MRKTTNKKRKNARHKVKAKVNSLFFTAIYLNAPFLISLFSGWMCNLVHLKHTIVILNRRWKAEPIRCASLTKQTNQKPCPRRAKLRLLCNPPKKKMKTSPHCSAQRSFLTSWFSLQVMAVSYSYLCQCICCLEKAKVSQGQETSVCPPIMTSLRGGWKCGKGVTVLVSRLPSFRSEEHTSELQSR